MRRDCFFLAGLLLLTLTCLWPVGHLGFIGYDDLDYVYQNPVVQSGLNPDSAAWAFNGAHAGNWHPLTWLSHMLDCELFGLYPQEEHVVNLLLHAANVLLLFVWLRGLTGAAWRSFFVAGLFALHPLHVQSVAWISERKDVLSGLFFLAVLLCYHHYCRNKNAKNYLLALVLLALGLMAKPMLVSTPLVLLLIDFWQIMRQRADGVLASKPDSFARVWRPLIVEKIPMFILCGVSCLVTIWAQSTSDAMHAMEHFPLPVRCLHVVVSYAAYLGKMVWPVNLAIFYPLSFATPGILAVSGSLLLLALIFTAGIVRRTAQPYLIMGWTWFFIMLLPVIGLVQVGLQTIADRYTYLPSIGLFIAVVWGVAEMTAASIAGGRMAACVGAVVLLACGIDTRYQLRFWKDNIALFQHVVDVSPADNFMGYFYLGISYGELGQLDAAARCLSRALEINPRLEIARSRLGNVLLADKKFAQAEPHLAAEAKSNPASVTAHATLGMALEGERKFAAAQAEYMAAQQLAPNHPAISQLLAANAPKASAETALANLLDELKRKPSAELTARAALAASALGRYSDAAQAYRSALAQNPDSVDCLNNLAWLLATCPDATVRNGAEAARLARHACEQTQYKQTVCIGTLAAACAEAGQFDEAEHTAEIACTNAMQSGESSLLESNQKLLNLYRQHQPYHEAARP